MKKLVIEIFEIKGGNEISTELDVLVLDLHKRYNGNILLKKIDVFNKEQIKPHKDIIEIIKKDGIDVLPLIKADGKVVSEEKLRDILKKY